MIENIAVTVQRDKPLPLAEEDLLAITGLFGIHPVPAVADKIIVEINPFTDCIRVNINSCLINNLQVLVYPTANYIENQHLRAKRSGAGIGARWVRAQTSEASSRNFRDLLAEAYRADNRSGDWTGYIVWAKYGYVMQISSLPNFQRFLSSQGRTETTLHELISTPDGLALWTTEGFSWDATFDLTTGSESHRILNDYFDKRDA